MKLRPWLLLLAAMAWLVAPATLFAQEDPIPEPDFYGECGVDADCPEGSYCLLVEEFACAMPPPCPEGDEDCTSDPVDEPCDPYVYGICMPDWLVECDSDLDCGPELECVTFQDVYCEGEVRDPCVEGGDCPTEPSEPVECWEESYAFCLPAYLAPCVVDEDCGEGFACRLEEWCWCDGEEPPGEDPGEDYDPSPNCGCETGDTGWCELVVQTCEDETTCPEGWSCEQDLRYGGDDPVTCEVDPDGNETCELPEPSDLEPICTPPYWNDIPGGGSGGPEFPGEGEDRDEDPVVVPGDDHSEAGGSDNDDDDGAGEADVEEEGKLFGCDASASGSGSPFAAAAMLLALGLMIRRRLAA